VDKVPIKPILQVLFLPGFNSEVAGTKDSFNGKVSALIKPDAGVA
jgi:hypothetical protein